jgi:hypothetical protein
MTNGFLAGVRKARTNLKSRKTAWSADEKQAAYCFFRENIRDGVVPGKQLCESCIQQHSVLNSRSWKDIKYFVYNRIISAKKLQKKHSGTN